jgi:hypothetical protein
MRKAESAPNARQPAPRPAMALWLTAGLALAALAYMAWFVQAAPARNEGQSSLRVELLNQLRDPFGFVAQWFGPAGTPIGLFDRLPIVLLAGVIVLAAFGLGRLAIDTLRLSGELTQLEESVLATAVGLNLLSTAVLLVGLAGLLQQGWLLWMLVVSGAGFALWTFWRDHWSRPYRDSIAAAKSASALAAPRSALIWLAIPFAAIILFGSLLPPSDFDVREYHLQVPKEWLADGRIGFLPHNVYGNMPLGAEMHALLAMALWPSPRGWFYGALAGKVVIATYAVLAALGVFAAGERVAGKAGGMLAGLVFLSHPWVIHVSVTGLNDGVLACYVFLAIYATWLARRGACSFLLPGLLAGAAASCKYPGLIFAVAPLAIWAAIPARQILNPTDDVKIRPVVALALFAVGVLFGGGAWYAKNAVLAGNPVYPLAYGLFGGKTRTAQKHVQWSTAHQVPPNEHGQRYSPRQFAGSLARIAGRDELASPFMLPLLAAAGIALVLASRSCTPQSAIRNPQFLLPAALAFLWILAVWWLVTHRIDRFLLPAWPLAAVLAAAALTIEDRWWRSAVYTIVAIGAGYCLLAGSSALVGDNRWFVALEQLRRDEPWPAGMPLRVSAEHKWLNQNVPLGKALLLVGDAAPFDLQMPVHYNTCFDDCLLCDWMLGKSAEERRDELARRQIAYVLVDWAEIRRYQSPGNYGFDPRFQPELVVELVEQGILGQPLPATSSTTFARSAREIYPVRAVLGEAAVLSEPPVR